MTYPRGSTLPKGQCVVCGKSFPLNGVGVLRSHRPMKDATPEQRDESRPWYHRCAGVGRQPVEGSILPAVPSRPRPLNRAFQRRCQEARRSIAWAEDQVRLAVAMRDATVALWGDRVQQLEKHEKDVAAWKAECQRIRSAAKGSSA